MFRRIQYLTVIFLLYLFSHSIYPVDVVTLDVELNYPWGFTWLNDQSLLITQKNGKLLLVDVVHETIIEIEHSIPSVYIGQGGLLDITNSDNEIWITCSIENEGKYTTALYYGILNNNKLTNIKQLYVALPYLDNSKHFGSRVELFNDYIYMTIGDRDGGMIAQDSNNSIGSVIRLHKNGDVPHDNPFVINKEWSPKLYQIGVRNPQGICLDQVNNELLISNHGPKGGDFIGPILEGSNYGWKNIAWGGTNYNGSKIGSGNSWEPGYLKPYFIWNPSIGISGIKVYSGNLFPEYNNMLLVTSLKYRYLSVLYRNNNVFVKEEIILRDKIGRIRDVEVSSSGEIFLIADEKNSFLYKLLP